MQPITEDVTQTANITDWISAISSSIGALAVVLALIQIVLMWRQMKADHERSRRERAIDAIRKWNDALTPVTAAAERLVGSLDEKECRGITNFQSITISKADYPLLEACLEELLDNSTLTDQSIALSKKQLVRLRSLIVNYLNETESLLLEWHLATADKKILEQQFDFLLDKQHGESVLIHVRTALGIDCFPAISAFLEHLKSKKAPAPDRSRGEVA